MEEEEKLPIGRAAFAKTMGYDGLLDLVKRIIYTGRSKTGVWAIRGVLFLLIAVVFGASLSVLTGGPGSVKTRTGVKDSYYVKFSENSLRISAKKNVEALLYAKKLKEEMEKDSLFWSSRDKMIPSGHVLYAYNLVRIATLERAVGSKEGELLAWDAFLKNAGVAEATQPEIQQACLIVAEAFRDGEVSLFDFIEQRRKELGSISAP